VAIAGAWRVGTRERTVALIGVIYAIIPAVFVLKKFHEDFGTQDIHSAGGVQVVLERGINITSGFPIARPTYLPPFRRYFVP
jgi:hypothetical protein